MNEQIRVLTEREKVRDKIGVWLESSKNHIHIVKELFGNSNDLIISGIGSQIKIELKEDNRTFIFEDDCTGVPVEVKASNGIDGYVAIFETLFAGSKYEQNTATVGTNGVFLAVMTMSAEYVKYTIGRPNGKVYEIEYIEGIRQYDLKEVGTTDRTFTRIECRLDNKVYDNPIFNYNDICDIAQYQAAISNVNIVTKYKDTEESYGENYRIEEYLRDTMEDKSIVDIIRIKKDVSFYVEKKEREDNLNIDFAFTFSNTNNKTCHIELLNGSLLDYHGSPYDGIINGIKNSINRQIKKENLYSKNEKQITNEDILVSLNHALDLKSLLTEYTNQTKRSTLAEHYKTVMQKEIEDFMEVYFIENQLNSKKICNQILINKRAREKSLKTMENVKKKLSEEITIFNRPQGLLDCKSKDKTKRILCIVEGNSALTSVINARDPLYMACMALRGKLLNVLKCDESKIFENEIITNIVRVLKCGVKLKTKSNKEFNMLDINKLDYNEIYIIVDADVDGTGSILPLVLTMFYVLFPEILELGIVHLIGTPKYEVLCEDKYHYASTDEQYENIINSLEGKKYKTFYVKGLAELDADTMAMCLSPEWENKIQIRMDNFKIAEETLKLWLGEDVKPRKEYILEMFDKEII